AGIIAGRRPAMRERSCASSVRQTLATGPKKCNSVVPSPRSPWMNATATRQSDVLIVGGGHNGLVCAAYLAATGLKVTVLERRHVVGGAAVTEEFHPGFRNSVASYTVSLLKPKVIRDLDLHAHGLRVVEREMSNFLPTEDGSY